MKKISALLVLTLSISLVSNSFAKDIIPSKGKQAIYVQPVDQDGVRIGAKILLCDLNRNTNAYSNCKAIGKREFYTTDEVKSLASRIRTDKGLMMLSAFISTGLVVGLLATASVVMTGGGSLLFIGGWTLSGGVVGTAMEVITESDMNGFGQAKTIRDGITFDEYRTVDEDDFKPLLEVLRAHLNDFR